MYKYEFDSVGNSVRDFRNPSVLAIQLICSSRGAFGFSNMCSITPKNVNNFSIEYFIMYLFYRGKIILG